MDLRAAFLLLALSFAPVALRADTPPDDLSFPPFVTARAWAVADGKTGELLWGQNAAAPQKAASTTKVMCAYVVLQLAAKDPAVLDERVTFSEMADGTRGTTSGIKAGESVPVRDCLYGLMLPSGNDAGNALAEHFNARCAPPGEELRALELDIPAMRTRGNFIAEMNRTAARIGLRQTTYRIPYGDGGTTEDRTISARDLTQLGSVALRDPLFRRIVSTSAYECAVLQVDGRPRTVRWTNTNQLLGLPGCDGIKTGTTPSAGACLLSSVHRRDDHLIVAVLGSATTDARYVDTQNLLRWAWQRRAAGIGPQLDADLVVKNAEVLTVDERQPRAQAFAVKDGRFVAVGSNADVARYVAPPSQMLDLAGKTVVPGFIDAHAHPSPVYPEDSPWAMVDCRPDRVKTIEELIAALKRKASQTKAGQLILGSRYQTTKLGREPTRWDLDNASTEHPIIIGHASGHQSVCNSLALQMANITDEVRDPAGGHFGRDAQGQLNGLLQETAAGKVRGAMAARPTPPTDEMMAAYREGLRRFLARGLTSVGVAGATPALGRLLERVRSDELPLRLNILLSQGSIDDAARRVRERKLGDEHVRYGTVKLFHGGSVSAHTCWVSRPYANRPDYFGVPPSRSQQALDELIARVHKAGLQIGIHANGDRDIDMVLMAFERAFAADPRPNHRHRIEHCAVLTDELIARIKTLGLVVVPHSYHWELGDTMEAFGEPMYERLHATRALLDAGVPVAAHSDSPVSTADPLLHIQAMVTRQSSGGKVYGPGQRVTVEQALHAWTLGGAYASFEEASKGSITPSKLADFVVLSANPATVAPERIKDIECEMTFVGGRRAVLAP